MLTRSQLAKHVLTRMGVIDPDESPTAKDDQDVQRVMESVYLSMKDRGHIFWDLDDIPSQYFDAFINVIADRASLDFGITDAALNQRAQAGRREILALSSRKIDTRDTEPTDY